jgi:hypothetical protein
MEELSEVELRVRKYAEYVKETVKSEYMMSRVMAKVEGSDDDVDFGKTLFLSLRW